MERKQMEEALNPKKEEELLKKKNKKQNDKNEA